MIDFYHKPQKKPSRRKRSLVLFLISLGIYALFSLLSGPDKTPQANTFLSTLEDSLKLQEDTLIQESSTLIITETPSASKKQQQSSLHIGDLRRVSIHIRNSLTATLQKNTAIQQQSEAIGLPRLVPMLVSHLQRPLVWKINLGKQIQKNDACTFIYRRITTGEAEERNDIPDDIEVQAIRYHSLFLNDTLAVYHYKPAGATFGSFYYANGVQVEQQFNHPIIKDYIQITAPFNEQRRKKHQGVDFKTPIGTPLLAPFSGVVSRINWTRKNNGTCLEITLNRQPYTIKYLHLSKIAVKKNQTITAGQIVAYSGNTGRSYAPHLHYQINKGARGPAINPMTFHKTHRNTLKVSDMPAFKAVVKKYDTIMLGRHTGETTR